MSSIGQTAQAKPHLPTLMWAGIGLLIVVVLYHVTLGRK